MLSLGEAIFVLIILLVLAVTSAPILVYGALHTDIDTAFILTGSLVVVGGVFYLLRCRQRLVYGILEVGVAIVFLLLAFDNFGFVAGKAIDYVLSAVAHSQAFAPFRMSLDPLPPRISKPAVSANEFFSGVSAALAALYVFVRGMDNVGEGLKGRQLSKLWRRIFFGKDEKA